MRLKNQHLPYIANKIALDLSKESDIKFNKPMEQISKVCFEALSENLGKERAIDERARELLEQHNNEIEIWRMDERDMFHSFKRQIAAEQEFSLGWDERCSDISHDILRRLSSQNLISFSRSEIIVKNAIHKAINDYARVYEKSEEEVLKKLEKYKRKLVRGSEEYEVVFSKLYEEELRKRGLV